MYWPTGSSLMAAPEESAVMADTFLEATQPTGPTPYTLTEGTPGPTIMGTPETKQVVIGKKSPSGLTSSVGPSSSTSSSGPSWYGSHLSVGRRP